MKIHTDGNAIVYCQGAYGTPNGKTAHGLVRRSRRYRIVSVFDHKQAGADAGEVLDGRSVGIPIVDDLEKALSDADRRGMSASHFVIGLAPDGGRIDDVTRGHVLEAIELGLDIDAGLHDFLSEDPEIAAAARRAGVTLRDVRKPKERHELHFFDGRIDQVTAKKIAVLGTDSAVGKRTTAWLLIDALEAAGTKSVLIGTGQTAWLQGARYSIVLDSVVNDFVAGELEHVAWRAFTETTPEVMVIEGQGSLLHPAYPGGFEILAALRPHGVVLQHAPGRPTYDGFPKFPIDPIDRQIAAIEMVGGCPVVAIALNHEGLDPAQVASAAETLRHATGLPVCDPLRDGAAPLVEAFGQAVRFRS